MYKISANYKPVLAVRETEHAIVAIKNFFQTSLSTELNLTRVTAPLFVPSGRGINDDLNGVEEPVSFAVKDMGGQRMEIVQSLAKWKRLKVTEMGCKQGFGIYTDMKRSTPFTLCMLTSGTGNCALTKRTETYFFCSTS